MSTHQLAIHFFLQLVIILVTCRLVGLAVRRFGQPQVVGEMIAGICLGPSFFGLISPELQAAIFPKTLSAGEAVVMHPLMAVLYCMAQLGLVLYMFCVGMEFDTSLLKGRARSALSISLAGILAPFLIGGSIAAMYAHDGVLFHAKVETWQACLFMGAAMSITAFPMLARIIYERGLTGTSIGTLALAAGSSDDAAAWCILAIVLASTEGAPQIAFKAIGGGVAYALAVLLVVRPVLAKLAPLFHESGKYRAQLLPVAMILLAAASWWTDLVGIYAVFGAFLLGIAMPRGDCVTALRARIEPLTTTLLLPAFFVYSGLNTQLATINTGGLWLATLLILAASIVAKFVACAGAARFHGESPRDALAIGALMNARGLMELILLNIGLERGVITPTLFGILVIMAIVTTLMATPLFEWVFGRHARRSGALPGIGAGG